MSSRNGQQVRGRRKSPGAGGNDQRPCRFDRAGQRGGHVSRARGNLKHHPTQTIAGDRCKNDHGQDQPAAVGGFIGGKHSAMILRFV